MQLKVQTLTAEAQGTIELSDEIFAVPVRPDILARVINWQLAKRRSGNHKTKGISEISGTTKKPFKQKGTGQARQGSLRSPQFRGGARIFGPVVRSHEYDLPKKIRKLGLKIALSEKVKSGQLIIVDQLAASGKTKELASLFAKNDWNSVLFIDGTVVAENFRRAAANIPKIDVLPEQGANVYDIIRHDRLVMTRAAVEQLEARLK